MKSDLWRRLFGRLQRRRETTGDLSFAEEILRTTKDHLSKDFPNPQREGCPPLDTVFNSFRSGKMPEGEDRAHILSCSECFNEYQIRLAEYRAAKSVPANAGGLTWWPRIVIPGLALGLLSVVIVVSVWKFSAGPRVDQNVTSRASEATGSPSPLPSPNSTKPEDEPQKQSTDSMLAVNQVTIDFEQATALRRQAPQQSKPIRLSATPHALLIKLPENSPRGSYMVTLNDAFGKSVRSKTTASANGKTLRVTFNLTGLNSGGYSICVTREQEVPSCLPVTVRTH
jgi:hypothetical protein